MTIDPAHFWIGETPMMPDNAYVTFFENVANHNPDLFDHLTAINMPWWFSVDEDCYDSQLTIQHDMLALFGFRARDHYPRLYMNWRAYEKRDMMTRFDSQYRLYNAWQDSYWQTEQIPAMLRILSAVDASNPANPFLVSFDGGSVIHAQPQMDFYRFTIENKGEWGKKLIRRAESQAEIILRHGSKILRDYAQQTGWEYRLRHPLAFGGGASESLINQRAPISHIDHVAPLPARLMADRLSRYGLVPILDNYRQVFDEWVNLNCTASFTHDSVNDTFYALTFIGLPAPLVKTPDHRLPVSVAMSTTQSILDQWQRIELLNHAEVQKGEIYEAGPTARAIDPEIQNLGWLVAAAATTLSAGLNVGQGNRKLSWLHSNINAAFVDHTMKVAPIILRLAGALVNHD